MSMEKVKEKKWHQKWWGIVILTVIVLLLAYFFLFSFYVLEGVQRFMVARQQSGAVSFGGDDQKKIVESLREFIETTDDPYKGNEDAKVVIVEFSDFQCPICLSAYPTVKQIMDEYGTQVKFIYRDFPITYDHPDAFNAAMAANCADDQDMFWEYHDSVFESQANLSKENLKKIAYMLELDLSEFNSCLDDEKYKNEVYNDYEDGTRLGITGTPTFFINGAKISGAIPYDTFKKIIEKLIEVDGDISIDG